MGDAMITDPDADLVTFTGSVRVGKHIAATAGYKRMVLELGGNDPLIVMEDADLDKAAELAVTGATKNSGQRCTAVKRILVVESGRRRVLGSRLRRPRSSNAAIRWIRRPMSAP
jgi:acyl-CoA reductase-like NAD-dependent aldehyde dehydrogenase